MGTFKMLFSPFKINTMEVKNRIFLPPMCTDYATIKGEATDRLIAYYAERAKGGAGLITVEFTSVHPKGKVFDEKLVKAVSCGDATMLLKLDTELIERAGECGLRSIIILLGAFDGLKVQPEVLSYEGPFGVGYMVASLEVKG